MTHEERLTALLRCAYRGRPRSWVSMTANALGCLDRVSQAVSRIPDEVWGEVLEAGTQRRGLPSRLRPAFRPILRLVDRSSSAAGSGKIRPKPGDS